MVSEFDLPCSGCGHTLERRTTVGPGGGDVTVAACPNCGSRHYPEDALGRF